RDMVVLESWEGTHNVLCLQVLKDCARYRLHEPYTAYLRDLLATVTQEALQGLKAQVSQAIDAALALLAKISAGDDSYQQAHARRMADAFSHTGQAACLLAEAQWELAQSLPTHKPDVCAYFINKRLVPAYEPMDDAGYLARIERLMMAY